MDYYSFMDKYSVSENPSCRGHSCVLITAGIMATVWEKRKVKIFILRDRIL